MIVNYKGNSAIFYCYLYFCILRFAEENTFYPILVFLLLFRAIFNSYSINIFYQILIFPFICFQDQFLIDVDQFWEKSSTIRISVLLCIFFFKPWAYSSNLSKSLQEHQSAKQKFTEWNWSSNQRKEGGHTGDEEINKFNKFEEKIFRWVYNKQSLDKSEPIHPQTLKTIYYAFNGYRSP